MTAKVFASLGSVWHTAAPSLEQFNRWVNSKAGLYAIPVQRRGDPSRSSLIAETAFKQALSDGAPAEDSEGAARTFLNKLPGAPEGGPLTDQENLEVQRIARNIEQFMLATWWSQARVHPVFPGCGFVGTAVGDLLIADNHLIEVKSVERGFRGLDFRQALTYSALAYASGTEVGRITLLNPRRATHFTTATSTLAFDLGAASWIDLMQSLVNAMTDMNPSQ